METQGSFWKKKRKISGKTWKFLKQQYFFSDLYLQIYLLYGLCPKKMLIF